MQRRKCNVVWTNRDRSTGELKITKTVKPAMFHKWGTELHENPDGVMVPFSVAIVEYEDGLTATVPAEFIQFTDQPVAANVEVKGA